MDTWRDIRAHLEAQDDPDLAAILAELTPADRQAAGPSWFARMVAQALVVSTGTGGGVVPA